jgi:hypothetical protein
VNGGNANNTPDGAAIEAGYNRGANPQGGSGVAQVGSPVVYDCYWSLDGLSRASESDLNQELEEDGGEQTRAIFLCRDPDTGAVVGTPEARPWPPEGEDPIVIDPYALAVTAHNQITLPVPHIATSPPISSGSYATLPTYLNVVNWDQGPLTASASAGPITVTVEANPVSAEWVIQDRARGTEHRVTCTGPGSLDGAVDDCAWTPDHSSDGQPADNPWTGEATGEPCFYAEVYFTWSMSWTVNGEPGSPALDDGVTAGSTCLVVAEVQAVIDDA